jgi:hypothetical protein
MKTVKPLDQGTRMDVYERPCEVARWALIERRHARARTRLRARLADRACPRPSQSPTRHTLGGPSWIRGIHDAADFPDAVTVASAYRLRR